ncbi:hypothetical protein BHE74_00007291 [Ensete ventricosum]|nr:hypothetical protein BHE74_00007291 [Ensete ventricosum]RZR87009.1 hypothetical protein BHM03_00014307 [Ensete ventricosum]
MSEASLFASASFRSPIDAPIIDAYTKAMVEGEVPPDSAPPMVKSARLKLVLPLGIMHRGRMKGALATEVGDAA